MNVVDFFQRGVAFIPTNVDGVGDVLMTYGNHGESEVVRITARSYLHQISKLFGVDLTSLRQRYGLAIGKKQMVPLPLAPNWTLIPVQARVPIGKQQAHGWIVKQAIVGFEESSGPMDKQPRVLIQLRGKHQMHLYHSQVDMQRILREALLVEFHYQLIHQTPDWVKESKEHYLYMM